MVSIPSVYTLYEITNLSKKILQKYPDDVEEINLQGQYIYLYTQIMETPIETASITEIQDFNKEMMNVFENTRDYSIMSFGKMNEICDSYFKMIGNSCFINYDSCRWRIDLSRFKQLKRFYVSNLYLLDIVNVPPSLTILISVNTFLKKIGELPSTLKRLVCNNNNLERLPNIQHTNLELLCFSSNQVSTLPYLPNTLKCLIFNNNNIITVTNLPKQLRHLECNMNYIRELHGLPETLITLSCSHNFIVKLPCLSNLHFLKMINCKSNNITEIPPLPGLIEHLDYSDNPIEIFVPFPLSLIA